MSNQKTVAQLSYDFCAAFESEGLVELLRRFFHHPLANDGDFRSQLLEDSHWPTHRVVPHGDLALIDSEWFTTARNAIVAFVPQRRESPSPAGTA